MVNGINKKRLGEYKRVHKDVLPEVVKALRVAGFRNWSIYVLNDELLVSFFELPSDTTVGEAFAKYFKIGGEAAKKWDELTRGMQKPARGLPPGSWWTSIPECWHMDCENHDCDKDEDQ